VGGSKPSRVGMHRGGSSRDGRWWSRGGGQGVVSWVQGHCPFWVPVLGFTLVVILWPRKGVPLGYALRASAGPPSTICTSVGRLKGRTVGLEPARRAEILRGGSANHGGWCIIAWDKWCMLVRAVPAGMPCQSCTSPQSAACTCVLACTCTPCLHMHPCMCEVAPDMRHLGCVAAGDRRPQAVQEGCRQAAAQRCCFQEHLSQSWSERFGAEHPVEELCMLTASMCVRVNSGAALSLIVGYDGHSTSGCSTVCRSSTLSAAAADQGSCCAMGRWVPQGPGRRV
jgi:hypothetical protein